MLERVSQLHTPGANVPVIPIFLALLAISAIVYFTSRRT